MADRRRRLPTNAPGSLYVDDTCIDCDTCRWMAPATFDEAGGQSRVHTQPAETVAGGGPLRSPPPDGAPPARSDVLAPAGAAAPAPLLDERQRAYMALLACPTASIGTEGRVDLAAARAAFPDPLDTDGDATVYHCGFHAESSFGATSYLLRRPAGNVLVDSPRWSRLLADRIAALGGVRWLFLTHRDDVADHARWAARFGCQRVMHADDARGLSIERRLTGVEPFALDPELTVVPVPGHTRGSACLIARARWCFTGDHLAWSESRGHLYAFRSACWYDWDAQIASMERLAAHRFGWILPGHGRRAAPGADAMPAALRRCIAWMGGASVSAEPA